MPSGQPLILFGGFCCFVSFSYFKSIPPSGRFGIASSAGTLGDAMRCQGPVLALGTRRGTGGCDGCHRRAQGPAAHPGDGWRRRFPSAHH